MSLHRRRNQSRGAALAAWLLLFLSVPLAGCGPSDPVSEIRELQAAGRFAESLEPLRDLAEARPDDAEVHYLHGFALLRTGQPSLALWSFRKAMEDPEWRIPAALQLAANALMTGNHDAAMEAAERILEAEPDHLEALLLRAQARLDSRRDYEGALADAERVLELDPDNVEALVPRSVALLGLERAEEAAVALEELERRFRETDLGLSNTPRFCAARAIFAREKGELETAEQRHRDCLEEFPTSFLVVQAAIEFYDEQRQSDRPIEILRTALDAAPFAIGYRSALAARLRAAGEVEEAEQILLDGTELENPDLAVLAWAGLGDHYLELEDYAAAATALEQAMAVGNEPSQELVFAYADALVMAGRYARALEVAGELAVPSLRDLVYGRAHLAQGRPGQALEWFTSGLRLSPNNAVARYYTALAAEGIGDFDRAIAEYRYSIRADPDATDVQLRLARLHEAEGAYELALTAALHRTTRAPENLDLERELVALRVRARTGRVGDTRSALARLVGQPGVWSRAVAAVAEGIRARQGPAAAAQWVRGTPQLDLTQPRNAEVLRALVVDLSKAGDADAARSYVAAGLAAHPEAAVFHEIRGLALERKGAPREEVRAAYERAVELDSENEQALAGLGRVAADSEAALAFYDRAAAADPEAAEPQRASAELLVSLGKREEAEQRLAALLEKHPYDGGAAARLAELRLERKAETDRTLELAQRAVRFGGGAEAYELLGRVHQRRGETELASEATSRAEKLRARAEKVP
jgi:tetratricopeptide (TPR) repeat protein